MIVKVKLLANYAVCYTKTFDYYYCFNYDSGINQGNRSMDSDTESMISSVSGYELGGKKKTR